MSNSHGIEHVHRFFQKLKRLLWSESGPTAVEYAVLLAFILLVTLSAINSVGSALSNSAAKSAKEIGAASNSGGAKR